MRNAPREIIWRDAALADLERIHDYLLPLNPAAARDVAMELVVAADSLATFPFRGRIGKARGTRELVIAWPYVLVYRVLPEEVRILRIWHAKQDRG